MSEQKHTPGPWKWFVGKDVDPTKPHIRHFVGANGQGFALTVGLGVEEDTANGNLIATAPELLEALKRSPHDVSCHPSEGRHSERCMEVRALIAKAEGRS